MAKQRLFQGQDLNAKQCNDILKRLTLARAVFPNDKVELLIGSTVLWGLGSCIICKQNEFTHFDMDGKMKAKTTSYPFSAITGIGTERPYIVLYIGGVKEKPNFIFSPSELETFLKFANERINTK